MAYPGCFAVVLVCLFGLAFGQQDFLTALRERSVGTRQPQRRVVLGSGAAAAGPREPPPSGRHIYWSWPNKVIPYYFEPIYSDQEKAMMRKAMAKIQSDVQDCIRYEEVMPGSPKFKIRVTPFKIDGVTKEKYCSSHPGILKSLMAQKSKEQRLVIAQGETGCFGTDGSIHSLMKMFTHITGMRNQHQHSDRDQYISVNKANIQPGMEIAFRLHPKESTLNLCDYDYCSITHIQPEEFALPGTKTFTVKKFPFTIPKKEELSGCDCREIAELYKCNSDICMITDCDAATPAVAAR
ncbi:hypothetical protein RvY_06937-2 [Ramazzottius varieornatus]|nr:hypothetical protein RvY_06937-2 [Ramazzottius varieornatus]